MRGFVIFCFLSVILLRCGSTLASPVAIITDSNKVEWRKFNQHTLETYRKNKDFIYDSNKSPDGVDMSWWQRFWQRVWNWINNHHIVNRKADNTILNYVFIGLGVAAIIFIIFKLIGMDVIQVFTRKSKSIEIPYEESLENIHEISFEDEIERAVNSRNFRLAVRLLYLGCLKKMSDAGMIHWKIDKTNSAYINEIVNLEKQQQFGKLTRKFEYIWYGDFPVEGDGFKEIHHSFQEFNRRLS